MAVAVAAAVVPVAEVLLRPALPPTTTTSSRSCCPCVISRPQASGSEVYRCGSSGSSGSRKDTAPRCLAGRTNTSGGLMFLGSYALGGAGGASDRQADSHDVWKAGKRTGRRSDSQPGRQADRQTDRQEGGGSSRAHTQTGARAGRAPRSPCSRGWRTLLPFCCALFAPPSLLLLLIFVVLASYVRIM